MGTYCRETCSRYGLIGIWTNKTIQGITKTLTQQMGWTEELAMERSKDLAYLNMQYATEINKIVKHNERILFTKIQKSEEEMIKYQHGIQNQWIHYKLTTEEMREAAGIRERMNWLKGRVPAEIREMMTKKIAEAKKEQQQERRQELEKEVPEKRGNKKNTNNQRRK